MPASSLRSRAPLRAVASLMLLVLAQGALAQEAPRFAKPLSSASRIGGPAADEASWPLAEGRAITVEVDDRGTRMPVTRCVYRSRANRDNMQILSFWASQKPAIEGLSSYKLSQIKQSVTADIVLAGCPPNFGEAARVIWGDDVMAQLTALETKRANRSAEREAAWEAQQARKFEAEQQTWMNAALALPPATLARGPELRKRIEQKLAAMEANLDTLPVGIFVKALDGDLNNDLQTLAQIAYVKSRDIKVSAGQRAQFDAWDEQWAGPVLTAIDRLERFRYWRANRRVRMSEMQASSDGGGIERSTWDRVEMNATYLPRTVLIGIFDKQLAGTDWLDRRFMQKVTDDLARQRPSGDPGRVVYRYQPLSNQWSMSPQEQDSQSTLERTTGKLIDIVGQTGELLARLDKLDADIKDSRAAFWRCYRQRCATAGQAFYAYSYAQQQKDLQFFGLPLWTQMSEVTIKGSAIVGAQNIDGGLVMECMAASNAVSEALAVRRKKGASIGDAVGQVLAGPEYQRWQACRDRMEYILRPRS